METKGANRRIVINTVTIYFRLVLTLGVSLFSTRYVLEALGETDFGLYNVIAGVVVMLSFIAATMATTSQRFISFSMGESKSIDHLKQIIGSSIFMHLVGSVVVAVIVMIGGMALIENVLDIPPGKKSDAIFVLWSVSIGLVGTINTVPFEATLMAHENILFVSVCQVLNAIIKLSGALLLLYIDVDRLRVYAMIMALLPFVLLVLQFSFCYLRYPESRVSIKDMHPTMVMKELGVFAGWVMFGTTCMTIRNQGVSIILNMFWGVVVNAANGVANQVNSTIQFFSTSIMTSLRPQLVKSAGENNDERMMTLVFCACKYPVLLMALAGCPLVASMPYVLSIWLKEVPEFTTQFCRLLLVFTMIRQSYMGLYAGIEAKGAVKILHLGTGVLHLSVIITGYFLARTGWAPESIYFCLIVESVLMLAYALLNAKAQIGVPLGLFVRNVVFRSFGVVALLMWVDYIFWNTVEQNLSNFVLLIIVTIMFFSLLTYFIGLTRKERCYLDEKLSKFYLSHVIKHRNEKHIK